MKILTLYDISVTSTGKVTEVHRRATRVYDIFWTKTTHNFSP